MSEIEAEGRELVITTDGRVRRSPVPEGVAAGLFRHVIAAVDFLYRRAGQFPTVTEICATWEPFVEKDVAKILATPEAREALEIRGIEMDLKRGLSDEQLMAVLLLSNPVDGRTTEAKLKGAGISMNRYRAWMRNPTFSAAIRQQSENNLTDAVPVAMNRLIAAAEAGDMSAVNKIFEISGRWNPQQQEVQNARAVVMIVMEAVQKYVDRDTLRKILDDVGSKSKIVSLTTEMNELDS